MGRYASLRNASVASLHTAVAIDFEASCLPRHGRSYPIEVGIADQAGVVRAWLIRPLPEWRDWTWTAEAEALHGVTRERLMAEGQPVAVVARELRRAVAGRRLFADSYIDQHWMHTLMAAAGEAQSPRVEHIEALVDAFGLDGAAIVACVEQADRKGWPRHRAGDDACWLAALITAARDHAPAWAPRGMSYTDAAIGPIRASSAPPIGGNAKSAGAVPQRRQGAEALGSLEQPKPLRGSTAFAADRGPAVEMGSYRQESAF